MTYETDEELSTGGEIIELHEFTTPNQIFRYTSHGENFTLDFIEYQVLAIKRTAIKTATQSNTPRIEVILPFDSELIAEIISKKSRFDSIQYKLTRVHSISGSNIIAWQGPVVGMKGQGRSFSLSVPSIFANSLETQIPNIYIQEQCNHVLYDERCGVDRVANTFGTEATSIISEIEFVLASVNGQADQFFRGGTLINGSTGESRMITDQVGTNIKVSYPFSVFVPLDSVLIDAGCNRSESDCKTKFDNWPSRSGHKFIPLINLFAEGLDS